MPFKRLSQAVMAEEEDDEYGSDENQCPSAATAGRSIAAVGAVTLLLTEDAVKVGSWLNGEVLVDRGLPPIAKLRVTIEGTAFTHFSADDGKEYKAKQRFLSELIDLTSDATAAAAGSNDDAGANEKIVVQFQYRLPTNVPPSFIGTFGGVRYECTANLKFAATSPIGRKRVQKVQFQVLPPKVGKELSVPATPTGRGDANKNKKGSTRSRSVVSGGGPTSYFHTHRVSSFGSADGAVQIVLGVDTTALKRGQTALRVVLDVTNKTDLTLRDLKFGISSTTRWTAKGRRLSERKYLAEECRDDFTLRPGKSIRFERHFAPIPVNAPPTIDFEPPQQQQQLESTTVIAAPTCQCAYALFVKIAPPTFANMCTYEVPLNVY